MSAIEYSTKFRKRLQRWILTNHPDWVRLYRRMTYLLNLADDGKITEELSKELKCHAETWRFLLAKYERILDKKYIENAVYNLFHSRVQRQGRLSDKVEEMCDEFPLVYFVTLTFNDEAFRKTNPSTRRYYVRRLLESIVDNDSGGYMRSRAFANIDYGEENGREHYHAVIACNSELELIAGGERGGLSLGSRWRQGFSYVEKVVFDGSDIVTTSKRIGKYVAKLTNHALKETGHNARLLYVGYRPNGQNKVL